MDAQRFRTGFDSEHLYSKLYNTRWPQTPEEHTLEVRVDVKRLRMEIVHSQPASPLQCDSSPRRLSAVGTELNEPEVAHAETQSTGMRGKFPLQVSFYGCTSSEQELLLLLLVMIYTFSVLSLQLKNLRRHN